MVVSPALVAEGCAWVVTEAEALGDVDGLEWLIEAPALAEEYPEVAPEPLEVVELDVVPEEGLVEVSRPDIEEDLAFCFCTWTKEYFQVCSNWKSTLLHTCTCRCSNKGNLAFSICKFMIHVYYII